MEHRDVIEIAKASQIATVDTKNIMLQALQERTDTDYSSAIALREIQIAKIQAL